MKQNNNIEDIFKQKFENFAQTPDENVWSNILQRIKIIDFFKFSPHKFNFYYSLIGIIAVTAVLYSVYTRNIQPEKIIYSENNTQNNLRNVKIKQNSGNNSIQTNIIEYNKSNLAKLKTENTNQSPIENISEPDTLIPESEFILYSEYNNFKTKNTETKTKLSSEFSLNISEGCAPLTVEFINSSKNAQTSEWDFGNGTKSDSKNPVITFENPGTYFVKLKTKNTDETIVSSKTVVVRQSPVADISISNSRNIYAGDKISFINRSQNYASCLWNFGDGITSQDFNPEHVYSKSGIYNIKLTAFSENNCTDSAQIIKLAVRDAKYKILAPNAFTPDMNGPNDGYFDINLKNNDVFMPVLQYQAADFTLRIYNRRGILIFESNNDKTGWNGYVQSTLSPMGVYVWECSGKFIDGQTFYATGDVSLIYTK